MGRRCHVCKVAESQNNLNTTGKISFHRMPLLQESTPKRDILTARDMKVEPEETQLKHSFPQMNYPGFPNPSMFTPSQLLMASQIMAASGLANPGFFHPGLLGPLAWPPNSPPSPPNSTNEQLSPSSTVPKSRKLSHNNNNNVVTSSTQIESSKKRKYVHEDLNTSLPLSSPTSSISPPSNLEAKGDKQFTCGVCNRSFGYKHVLQNHERTHTGEKPFECPECHKRFTRDHHLKTHMRLHTGERPYHCEHCDRQFVQVANLRRHLRVHTGERPYTCEHCDSKFSDSNQLKAHMLIHTNEKPFSCEKCQSRFRRRHHLMHHKCGVAPETDITLDSPPEDLSPSPHDDRMCMPRVIHAPTPPLRSSPSLSSPLLSFSLPVALPEQTEPEDLSMSTGMTSNSSGVGSPLSRSPSLKEDFEEDDFGDLHDIDQPIFLGKRSLSH